VWCVGLLGVYLNERARVNLLRTGRHLPVSGHPALVIRRFSNCVFSVGLFGKFFSESQQCFRPPRLPARLIFRRHFWLRSRARYSHFFYLFPFFLLNQPGTISPIVFGPRIQDPSGGSSSFPLSGLSRQQLLGDNIQC